ncbi:hypothetical protein ScalyP_jg6007 [Parmales sp. scaly parma]|nr:hypothetical protein ScalyP_jg6007 [Parmales sp. scaly parma]
MTSLDSALTKIEAIMVRYPSLCFTEKCQQLETQFGQSKVYFFLAFVVIAFSTLFALGGSKLVSDLFGFVYPAYMSFKAVDSADPNDDTQWLTYWVVFACFSILESGFAFIVGAIPFYFFLKCALFIWLYHPSTQGASTLYCKLIRPNLLQFMDSNVEKKSD